MSVFSPERRFKPRLAAAIATVSATLAITITPAAAQQLPAGGGGIGLGDDGVTTAEGRRTQVTPYIEVGQVLLADLNNDNVVTFSVVAAGVDAGIRGQRAEGQVSVRYERRIEWGDEIGDQDILSGIARGSVQLIPNALSFEAGGLATRSSIDVRGAQPTNVVGDNDNIAQLYSVFAGPSVNTNIGSAFLNANYRFGYASLETDNNIAIAPGQPQLDVFDESTSHFANATIGQLATNSILPFGWTISGGYRREDTTQLDQRFEDAFVRGDITVPLSPTFALVGGAGYEDVEVSERDALRDDDGTPLVGADGRIITDPDSPRLLSFDASGLIWDVGVLWRPSSRTSLEARYGRRYQSETYYGNFNWQANRNTVFSVNVFDTVAGFGARIIDNVALLPTQFTSFRNPISGDLNGCVIGGENNLCLNDGLQSAASSLFRLRGVNAVVSTQLNGWQTGLALGYNRRRFLNSDIGVLADIAGGLDENYFANFFATTQIDASSAFSANVYANYFDSAFEGADDVFAVGANAAYLRNLTRRLRATAAVGLDTFDVDGIENPLTASALLGLRYSF
ncbi:hypothetical protein [Alterisphingorhabdus coralli]|uniref:Preprotein translocase subunit YajC n=1 Tax=Alterisphingorhabdus coralli TaxID=3071408 RepID=A0AA97F764_9SPHN|nr:hypothetical protein [Parasphingorhabdus sp. SCSIO 66989]WOE73780.1 hypothetical protein RB602_07835 [Parasphingorhabdus sp. SCSIO 66989]